MSEWYEADNHEIDIDMEDKEVSIFVKANDWGRVYLTLSFDQIRDINAKILATDALQESSDAGD